MNDVAISVENLGKRYRIWTQSRPQSLSDRVAVAVSRGRRVRRERPLREELWALRGASFEVRQGEVLGVIGPNGAGKSTLLSILARITEPTEGRAEIRGRVGSLLEVGTGFHPELSGRDNVYLNGAILGMSRAEVAKKFDEIVDFSGVREFIDMPVKRYSSGMYVRLGFAVAAHLEPEVLLLDEVLAVGDRSFQERCLRRIDEITHDGRTVVFVSHDLLAVSRLCRRAVVIDEGRVAFDGQVDEAMEQYGNTHALGDDPDQAAARHEGSGEARIAHVRVDGGEAPGIVRADQPIRIELEFEAERALPGEGLELSVGITTSAGMYVLLSTAFDLTHPLASGIESGTTMSCVLDELPLKPGRYTVSATLERMGEVVDRVVDQSPFRIVPSDVFGTGVPPTETHVAPVVVRHRWTAADRLLTTRGS